MQIINRHRQPNIPGIYIGRGTPLGNPYIIGQDGNRAEVLQKYRDWLYQQVRHNNRSVLDALDQLNDNSVLICSCKPAACHGDVVSEIWHWAQFHGLLNSLYD